MSEPHSPSDFAPGPQVQIVEFTASATAFAISDVVTLTWQTLLANWCNLSVDQTPETVEVPTANGTTESCSASTSDGATIVLAGADGSALGQLAIPAPLPDPLVFRLTAVNVGPVEATVPIQALPAQIDYFELSQPEPGVDLLVWSTSYAKDVSLDNGIGIVGPSGQLAVSGPATYTLSANGIGGPVSQPVHVPASVADTEV